MGFDSNNQQYPLAFGLVDNETTSNWSWFLYHLRRNVCRERMGVCIISDRHVGIIEAMRRERNGFTGDMGIHRFCLLHIRSNFSSAHPGTQLKMLCWLAGNTSAHKIIPYNQERGVFEVTTARYKTDKGFWKDGNKHHIDLSKGYCSCGKWHRYHSPCSHIVAACMTCHLDWKQYIEPYQTLSKLHEK